MSSTRRTNATKPAATATAPIRPFPPPCPPPAHLRPHTYTYTRIITYIILWLITSLAFSICILFACIYTQPHLIQHIHTWMHDITEATPALSVAHDVRATSTVAGAAVPITSSASHAVTPPRMPPELSSYRIPSPLPAPTRTSWPASHMGHTHCPISDRLMHVSPSHPHYTPSQHVSQHVPQMLFMDPDNSNVAVYEMFFGNQA